MKVSRLTTARVTLPMWKKNTSNAFEGGLNGSNEAAGLSKYYSMANAMSSHATAATAWFYLLGFKSVGLLELLDHFPVFLKALTERFQFCNK